MKKLFVLLLLLTPSTFAIDLQIFHNKNFVGTSYSCGLHVEVSGNQLITTDIIPPDMDHTLVDCKHGPTRSCIGFTEVYNCSAVTCESTRVAGKKVLMLEDGNMVTASGIKFLFHNKGPYWWCLNP